MKADHVQNLPNFEHDGFIMFRTFCFLYMIRFSRFEEEK